MADIVDLLEAREETPAARFFVRERRATSPSLPLVVNRPMLPSPPPEIPALASRGFRPRAGFPTRGRPIPPLLGQPERFSPRLDITHRSESPYRRFPAPVRDQKGPKRPSAARWPGHSQAPKTALTRGARRRPPQGPHGRPGRLQRGTRCGCRRGSRSARCPPLEPTRPPLSHASVARPAGDAPPLRRDLTHHPVPIAVAG